MRFPKHLEHSFGQTPTFYVIELTWANNGPNISAIPTGTCTAHSCKDGAKARATNLKLRWRLPLNRVEGRSAIQLHQGNDEQWAQRCFIVGKHLVNVPTLNDLSGHYCKITNGEAARERLRAVFMSPSADNRGICFKPQQHVC